MERDVFVFGKKNTEDKKLKINERSQERVMNEK